MEMSGAGGLNFDIDFRGWLQTIPNYYAIFGYYFVNQLTDC